MRFLIDNNLPPRFAEELSARAHDAVHVRDTRSHDTTDDELFALAAIEGRVIVAQDADFGAILATRNASRPSVILFRCRVKSVESLLAMLLVNLPSIAEDLEHGAMVVFDDFRVRVRRLPFLPV